MKVMKEVAKRLGSRLKLRYQENKVDLPVILYLKLIGEAFYPFFDLEQADVLLSQLFATLAKDGIE